MQLSILHQCTFLVFLSFAVVGKSQETAQGKTFEPRVVRGLADIQYPTPSKVYEPLSAVAYKAANDGFQIGIQHMQRNNNVEAIAVFHAMIEAYPGLREPYNNLAILYARQRDYDKSRAALALMLRAHPNYQNGHETLGDVYMKMATESYRKAFYFDTGSMTARQKTEVIQSIAGLADKNETTRSNGE